MNNITLPPNSLTRPNFAVLVNQGKEQSNPVISKFICMAVGHKPQNIGNRLTVGTYPGTRKQVYVQHRACKRCNCIINSVTTIVDIDQSNTI